MARRLRGRRAHRRSSPRGAESPSQASPLVAVLTPMGESPYRIPPFASPAEAGIGTFWAFSNARAVPSVFSVIRKLLSAHSRGAIPRYAAAVLGAAFVYGIEQ